MSGKAIDVNALSVIMAAGRETFSFGAGRRASTANPAASAIFSSRLLLDFAQGARA
jgi:hypothetical protein